MRTRIALLLMVVFAFGFLSARMIGADLPRLAPAQPASADPAGGAQPPAPSPAVSPAPPSDQVTPAAPPSDLAPEELRTIEIFRRASSSVVNITNIALRRDFFTMDVFQIPQGTGSGFVWDTEGHIVTNFHVVEGASSLSVTLADRSEADAEVIGVAPDKDLAVLKIKKPASGLTPLPLGRSADLQVGQTVLALGNPFGLDHSLTVGIVSALGRELQSPGGRTIRDVIQTDAAINPGNSGGPLLDSRGRLIGINSQIVSPSGASAGIGFAVPVDTVKRLVPQLIEHGKPIQPGIGVSMVADRVADRMGVEGVVVYDVRRGGPADQAGLEGITRTSSGRITMGDVIVAVDGKAVRSSDDLFHAFEAAGVGASVRLTVERDGHKRDITIKLVPLD